ncbi:MAG: LacI family DNA-binding transcriptional regulator [Candidatus Nanopelagicales bacterium]
MAVTLAHVARAAHVSVSTASAALRGSTRINADTAAHVREVAQRLGYRANSAAAGLRRGDPELIGLLLSRAAFAPDPASPRLFWPRFLTGFADGLADAGHGMVVVAEESRRLLAQSPIHAVAMAADPVVDGRSLVPFGTPVLRWGDPRTGDVAGHDYGQIAELVVSCLADAGRRNLALIFAHDQIPGMAVMRDELRATAVERGMSAELLGSASVAEAVAAGADAVVTPGTDVPGLLRQLAESGRQVPRDVAVISVAEGDVEAQCDPTVTHVSLRGHECGRLVAAECVRLMQGGTPRPVVLPCELVAGASV